MTDAWMSTLAAISDERERAHEVHRANSMEAYGPTDLNRLCILLEEVGEVAKEYNEARVERRPINIEHLRTELIQVAAMAYAWADNLADVDLDTGAFVNADRKEHE